MPNCPATPPQVAPPTDEELVRLATNGDPKALRELLARHQTWIFNLVLYMLHTRQDAEDATQEILVKMATALGSFEHRSSFRTWARKIAVRHVLDYRRTRPEQTVTGFGCYSEYLETAPEAPIPSQLNDNPETALLIDEARISCVMGMLLCLDREQRIVFLLGEILEVSDAIGADLLELSRDNFRQRLSRTREQLSAFMLGRCGLVNPENSCRCARKTGAFIRDGIVDPKRLQFAQGHLDAITLEVEDRNRQLGSLVVRTQAELRQLYPLFKAPDVSARLEAMLDGSELKSVLDLS